MKVQELINEIKGNLSQHTSNKADEVRVMQAMLNDKDYAVGIYDKSGQVGTFNPSLTAREMSASTISRAARLPIQEAKALMANYEYTKTEAEALVGISKEFINTYVQTDRKLPLGGRENSDVSLSLKRIDAGIRRYPTVVGVDENENKINKTAEVHVPAYESIKSNSPCPAWKKKNKK